MCGAVPARSRVQVVDACQNKGNRMSTARPILLASPPTLAQVRTNEKKQQGLSAWVRRAGENEPAVLRDTVKQTYQPPSNQRGGPARSGLASL
jgi:hypothetical protein